MKAIDRIRHEAEQEYYSSRLFFPSDPALRRREISKIEDKIMLRLVIEEPKMESRMSDIVKGY